MHELPKIEELKTLSLRALAAYAARAALRVRPLLLMESLQENATPIDLSPATTALELAIGFAQGVSSSTACTAALEAHSLARSMRPCPARRAVLATAYAADTSAKAMFACYATTAANYSADAAGLACNIDYVFTPKLNATVIAEDVAYSAANTAIASCAASESEALFKAATRDYKRLRKQRLGSFPHVGKAIDVGEEGPLESLWPPGSSRWLSKAGKLDSPAHRAALAIWYATGMQRKRTVQLSPSLCLLFDLSPDHISQAVASLKAEKMISVSETEEAPKVAMK